MPSLARGALALPAEHWSAVSPSVGAASPGPNLRTCWLTRGVHARGGARSGSVCGSQERRARGTRAGFPSREAGRYLPPSAWGSQLSLQAQHLQVCSPSATSRSRLLHAPARPSSPGLTGGRHCRVPGPWPFRQSVQPETPSSPPFPDSLSLRCHGKPGQGACSRAGLRPGDPEQQGPGVRRPAPCFLASGHITVFTWLFPVSVLCVLPRTRTPVVSREGPAPQVSSSWPVARAAARV